MGHQPIGILGGTFDPIHHGHLRSALEAWEDLALAEIRFIPGRHPPHRETPMVTAAHRLAMLELAIAGQPGFVIDERELQRDGPSYMVDTLTSLRAEVGSTPLCLIIGMDVFAELHQWHRWQDIPGLTHLLVLQRPGSGLPLSEALGELVSRHKLHNPTALRERPAGGIIFQPVSQLDISATRIRQCLACGNSPRYLLPEPVLAYIRRHGLYQPPSSA